jgi:hypothetical protein
VQYVIGASIFVVWLFLVWLRCYIYVRVRRGLKPALAEAELLPWPSNRLATMRIWWHWLIGLRYWFKYSVLPDKRDEMNTTNMANSTIPEVAHDFWAELAQAKGFPQNHRHGSRGYLADPALIGGCSEPTTQPAERKNG